MDGRHFDELTRVFSVAASRRRLLRSGGGAATLAGLAQALRSAPVVAVEHDPRCPENALIIDNETCGRHLCVEWCGTIEGGFCARTVAGARDCVQPLACPTKDECDADRDCATGEVCVTLGGCCCQEGSRRQRRRCKRRHKCALACPG